MLGRTSGFGTDIRMNFFVRCLLTILEDIEMQFLFWIELTAILAVSAVVFGITWIEIHKK